MWGKELMKQGSRWRIGYGRSIRIYKDRWIPRLSTFKVSSLPVLGVSAIVQCLKLPNGSWNKQLVKRNFCVDEVDVILSLPPYASVGADRLLWNFYKGG